VHQLLKDFKKAYDSIMRTVLYNIPIKFGIPMKLARLIKMFLNETFSRVRLSRHLSDMFSNKNGLGGKRYVLSSLLFNFALGYAIRKFQVPGWI